MEKHCNNCKNSNVIESIPYVAHEAQMTRADKHARRLWIVIIVCIALLFASNMLWLLAWTNYDYSSTETTYTQDGHGTNIMGDNNEVTNGAKTSGSETDTP